VELRDLVTDGQTVAWSITDEDGGEDAGVWIATPNRGGVVPARLDRIGDPEGFEPKCRLLAIQQSFLACVGYTGDSAENPQDQYLRIYEQRDAGWTLAPGDAENDNHELGGGGLIVSVAISGSNLVFERDEEDGLFRIHVLRLREVGAVAELVYGRTGDDLGLGTLYGGEYYFADSGPLGQPEIMRMRLDNLQVDRVTTNDAVQHHPGVGFSGLAYVDHRYVATGQGRPLVPPALTLRRP